MFHVKQWKGGEKVTDTEYDVLIRAIKSRICECEGLNRTLGINYDTEIQTLQYILNRFTLGFKLVSRETMCKSLIEWFKNMYDEEW